MSLAIPEDVVRSWSRCAYLLHAVSSGNYKALDNAGDAALEAARLLTLHGLADEWVDLALEEHASS